MMPSTTTSERRKSVVRLRGETWCAGPRLGVKPTNHCCRGASMMDEAMRVLLPSCPTLSSSSRFDSSFSASVNASM
jgi:hypothetical protein